MQLAKFGDAWQQRQYHAQGLITGPGLGLVPAWNYSSDPGVNIMLNPNVKFPPGWNQRTVQPIDPSCCQPPEAKAQLKGAFDVFDSWAWTNRKWLVLGGVGTLGAALLVGAVAVLR